jgi:hypothetical protein
MIGLFPLKQSTASQEVLLGPFIDDTDGKTAETALSIANTDIKLWKSGGTTESNKASGGATHIASGRYYAVLDATDTDTLGPLELNVHMAGALPVKLRCIVLTANAYDSLVSGSDKLQVDTAEVSGTVQTAGNLAAMITAVDDFVDTEVTAIKTKTDQLTFTTAGKVDSTIQAAADFAQAAADKVWSTAARALTDKANFTLATDAINSTTVATSAVTEFQAGLATSSTVDAINIVSQRLNTTLEIDGAVYRFTVNALEQAPVGAGEGGATPAEIADAVWDELLAGHNTVGTAGAALTATSKGDVWSTVVPGAYPVGSAGEKVGTYLNATVGSRATQTSVDGINTNMNLIPAIKLKTDNLPADPADASDIAASFTTVNGKLDTIDNLIDPQVAQIKAKTDLIPASPAVAGGAMALVANSVNASSITPDAVSEIQSGLATAAALAIVNDLLDPEIAQILARVNSIPTNPATAADIPTPQEIATAHLDLPDGIETGWTVREATRVILGEAGGLLNGAQTPTNIFTNPAGTKNRITATVDEDGNRTAIVYDKT